MKYENLCAKYGVTPKEIQEFVEHLSKNIGSWGGDTIVMVAGIDLICNGDIPPA